MKRNKQSSRVMRRRSTETTIGENSRYALKAKSGKQWYGPGCCAHHRNVNYNAEFVELLRRTNSNKSRRIACV